MKKVWIILVAAVLLAGIVVGCVLWYRSATAPAQTPSPTPAPTATTAPTPTVAPTPTATTAPTPAPSADALFTLEEYPRVDASLAIHPLANSLAADFLCLPESELDFKYTTTRTSDVYRRLIDGEVDVIFAAEISAEDRQYAKDKGVELTIIPATSSAFVFIVNTDNPVEGLTLEQIRQIYAGQITDWSQVGGAPGEIIAYQRPTGSGSQTAMLSLVMGDTPLMEPPLETVRAEMGELIDAIADYANDETAIGYSYFYYVNTMYKRDTIKMLAVDGVAPSLETIKNGTYPIYTNGFIVLRADEEEGSPASRWVEAVLSERGSRIIEEAGYVPVN